MTVAVEGPSPEVAADGAGAVGRGDPDGWDGLRCWWLKRLAVAAVVLLVALVGLRWWWGVRAAGRLEAVVAAIAARGEPIRFEDVVVEPVDDDRNAAVHLERGLRAWPVVDGEAVVVTRTDWFARRHDVSPPPDPVVDDAAYLEAVGEALVHLRRMEVAEGCDWAVRPRRPAWTMPLPATGIGGEVAALLIDAATRAGEVGDGVGVLDLAGLVLSTGGLMNRPLATLGGHEARLDLAAGAYAVIEREGPGLRLEVGGDGVDGDGARPAARAMIGRLLDEAGVDAGFQEGLIGHRWMIVEAGQSVVAGRLGLGQIAGPGGWPAGVGQWCWMRLAGPVVLRDTARVVDYLTAMIEAAGAREGLPVFAERLDALVTDDPRPGLVDGRVAYPVSAMALRDVHAAVLAHFQAKASRRMAAVALAVMLYRADHGALPATLAELVPDYLPQVPRDPYTRDDPVRYRREGATLMALSAVSWGAPRPAPALDVPGPAVVYCVGMDRVDGGGIVMLEDDGTISRRGRFSRDADHWFLLEADPGPLGPVAGGTTLGAVGDQSEVADQERKAQEADGGEGEP